MYFLARVKPNAVALNGPGQGLLMGMHVGYPFTRKSVNCKENKYEINALFWVVLQQQVYQDEKVPFKERQVKQITD
jgi:hypothetical protein